MTFNYTEESLEAKIRIMNITNGDEVNGNWETIEEAEDWIESKDIPDMYMIME